jgi:ABC-2 type transport system ATP-binding protein
MQQRLGLGVALLGLPDLILLDEPTSALDPVGRHDVREIVRHLKARGATVFLNSHLLTEVEQVCDRVAMIDRGRVIAMGTLDELRGEMRRVRLRAAGLECGGAAVLHRFGTVQHEGGPDGWITIVGPAGDDVPRLVAELVAVGARIYAVEPARESLEERFLELLGGNDADSDDRAPDTA